MKKLLTPGLIWAIFFIATFVALFNHYNNDKANFFKYNLIYSIILACFFLCSLFTYIFDSSKSKAVSLVSFAFGLAFFIPLLNLIFGIPAIYFGIISIKKIRQNPKQFGGKWFAILGISFGALVYLTYLIGLGMCIAGLKDICTNIGLGFLANK